MHQHFAPKMFHLLIFEKEMINVRNDIQSVAPQLKYILSSFFLDRQLQSPPEVLPDSLVTCFFGVGSVICDRDQEVGRRYHQLGQRGADAHRLLGTQSSRNQA